MRELDKYKFLMELNSYGYRFRDFNEVKLIYKDDKVLIPVILKYLDSISDFSDKEYLVRCITKKGYFEATEKLLSEFYCSTKYLYKWAIGNALYTIKDTRFIMEYIKIVRDARNAGTRQMIVLLLGLIRSEEAKMALLEVLHQDDITLHVIDALSKYKDKTIIPYLEYFVDDVIEQQWISRVKKLKEEAGDNIDYKYIDPKAAWKAIKKEAQKALKKLSKIQ